MFVTMTDMTRIQQITWNQSYVHFGSAGGLVNTISGVLLRVEKYPKIDMPRYSASTRIIDLLMIFMSLYLTGFYNSE